MSLSAATAEAKQHKRALCISLEKQSLAQNITKLKENEIARLREAATLQKEKLTELLLGADMKHESLVFEHQRELAILQREMQKLYALNQALFQSNRLLRKELKEL